MSKRNKIINIAVDCMGGDHAPDAVLHAVDIVLQSRENLHFLLYGQQEIIDQLLKKYTGVQNHSTVIDTGIKILATDQPSLALRGRRGSSMHLAVEAVRDKKADCVVSAGNTGALMAVARLILGTLPNIKRPAIITALPAHNQEMALLDLGANVDCDAITLSQFAMMGSAFAMAVFNKENPTVALLNVGTEEVKGTDAIKDAHALLKESDTNFVGYIEADQMFINGGVDVVVTDGFCGNVMLKTTQGIYKVLTVSIKEAFASSIVGSIAGLIFKYIVKEHLKRFDPKLRNGAMLVGLNGVVIKSHGSADAKAFANAILVAINAVKNNINQQIMQKI